MVAPLSRRGPRTTTFHRRFMCIFGVTLHEAAIVFARINMFNAVEPTRRNCEYLLWALNFLRCYPKESAMAVTFHASEKTIREHIWAFIAMIAGLDWIDFSARFDDWSYIAPSCSIDGTDCPVEEPRAHLADRTRVDPAYYSFKLRGAALRYNVVLSLASSRILHVHGGVPAGANPDIEIARAAFVEHLRPREMVVADRGFKDHRYFMFRIDRDESSGAQRLTEDETVYNYAIGQVLARHEKVNAYLKSFAVLQETFRHRPLIEKHRLCFAACAQLLQLRMANNPQMLHDCGAIPIIE